MKNWTPKFPTQPGWYWTKTPYGDERLFEIVPAPRGIQRLDPAGKPVRPEVEGLALRFSPNEKHPSLLDSVAFDGWSWFGPVEPPQEPGRADRLHARP
jgi:hypothetical protein